MLDQLEVVVRTKEVLYPGKEGMYGPGVDYLNLERLTGDSSFPHADELYMLTLSHEPGGMFTKGAKGGGALFLVAPFAFVFSKAVYEEIFEKIETRDDFFRLSEVYLPVARSVYAAVNGMKCEGCGE